MVDNFEKAHYKKMFGMSLINDYLFVVIEHGMQLRSLKIFFFDSRQGYLSGSVINPANYNQLISKSFV